MKHLDDIFASDEFAAFLQHSKDETLPAMLDSAFVVTIAPDAGQVDVKIALEIGLTLLLDKPLVLLVDDKRAPPRKLMKIADYIVRGDLSTPAGREILYERLSAVLKHMRVAP